MQALEDDEWKIHSRNSIFHYLQTYKLGSEIG